jgi:hypothetical protein
MITVSNAKVAGFVPEWAPFRGFSILFDTPGDSVRPTERYELLACDVDSDPALGFYRALRDALASLDVRLLTHAYLFCPLPPASYHVTVWDGANDGNAPSVAPEHREPIRHLLEDLPAALRERSPLIQTVRESALVTRRDWKLSFRANSEHAQLAQPCVAQWSAAFAERLNGHVLSFAHASIYGFSDMATFFRAST